MKRAIILALFVLFATMPAFAQETTFAVIDGGGGCSNWEVLYLETPLQATPGHLFPLIVGYTDYQYRDHEGNCHTVVDSPIIVSGIAILVGGEDLIRIEPSTYCYAGDWSDTDGDGWLQAGCGVIRVWRSPEMHNGNWEDGVEFIFGFRR